MLVDVACSKLEQLRQPFLVESATLLAKGYIRAPLRLLSGACSTFLDVVGERRIAEVPPTPHPAIGASVTPERREMNDARRGS